MLRGLRLLFIVQPFLQQTQKSFIPKKNIPLMRRAGNVGRTSEVEKGIAIAEPMGKQQQQVF